MQVWLTFKTKMGLFQHTGNGLEGNTLIIKTVQNDHFSRI